MLTKPAKHQSAQDAYALIIVMALSMVSLTIFAGIASWTASCSKLNDRNNTYNKALGAAEAATETVMASMGRDFLNQSYNPTQTNIYAARIPSNSWASAYLFSNGSGGANRSLATSTTSMTYTNLDSQFLGLYGLVYACSVRGQAKPLNSPYDMAAAVRQDFQLAAIPVFQFAIFYSMDLEINPGAPMIVTGKVHGNARLYSAPPATLEYADDVTATGQIYTNRMPDDPTVNTIVTPTYDHKPVANVSSLTLPISTNNNPDAVHGILEIPPLGEDALSEMGKQRYYNNCDLIVTTTSSNVLVQAGNWDSFANLTPDTKVGTNYVDFSFVNTTNSFYDAREAKWTQTTEIDVGKLGKWMTNTAANSGLTLNNLAQTTLGRGLSSVYVRDLRPAGTKLPAVRVSNGQFLPPNGLTVATEMPLYVKGHFNAPDTTGGSTNTAATKPASLLGDAITVLSSSFSDTYGNNSLGSRPATDTTVNAAFLARIVPTTNYFSQKKYSGGVENFPRFLENWSGDSFTYNGSMVVMFPCERTTGFWVAPGTYYNAPSRKWAFDLNFMQYTKLPPATPLVRKLVRGQWHTVAAN